MYIGLNKTERMIEMIFSKNEKTASVRRSVLCAVLAATVCFSAFAGGCKDKNNEEAPQTSDTAIASSAAASSKSESSAASDTSKDSSSAASSKASKDSDSSKKDASSKASSSKAASSKAASSKAASSKTEQSSKEQTETSKAAEPDDKKTETSSVNSKSEDVSKAETGYKAGQTVTLYVKFGNISMNGEPAKIGAYNYDITYDADTVEYVSGEPQTKSDYPDSELNIVNTDKPGMIDIAHVAAYGFSDDFTGEKKATYKVTFKVLKDTADLGISGNCPSLTAVSMDAKNTLTLINSTNTTDDYSGFTIE